MRRITWVIALVVCVSVFLGGCGKKDAAGVVQDLEHMAGSLKSYQGTGKMMLNTGQTPQEYDVEVWYQDPDFYRISLTNEKKDITQIVLRNKDGVFVLTPHLNKSFRFQSNWPDSQGQVYLYQTLIQSIIADKDRQFVVDEEKDAYVFDVLANYQNSSLSRQKIWLDRSNYAPQHVEVSDVNANVIVAVDFAQFEFDLSFEKDSFDMKRNMTSFNLQTVPTLTEEEGVALNGTEDDKASQPAVGKEQEDFGILEFTYVPEGVQLKDISEIKLGEGEKSAVLLRYSGLYNYTILETRPEDRTVFVQPGTILDLGYTVGILTGDAIQTLTWMDNGVEFRLSAEDLPQAEMIQIAQSVQGQIGK
ncbi:MAG TPA: DUF4367 domain-containing protein [Bacilli bacterium]